MTQRIGCLCFLKLLFFFLELVRIFSNVLFEESANFLPVLTFTCFSEMFPEGVTIFIKSNNVNSFCGHFISPFYINLFTFIYYILYYNMFLRRNQENFIFER